MPTPYGLFAAAGCAAAVSWLFARRERLGLTEARFWISMWGLLLGAAVGAKGLFALLGWQHYARGELRFWADFGTGWIFFGGLAGASAAGWALARAFGVPFLVGADYFAIALPLAHALGRIGCFFQGCCPGRSPGPFSWAAHPVQLYEAAALGAMLWAGRSVLRRVEEGLFPAGSAFRLYLILYGLLRFFLDFYRADGRPERFLGLSHQQGLALSCLAAAWIIGQGTTAPRVPAPANCAGPAPPPRR